MDPPTDDADSVASLVLKLYSSLRFQPPPQQYTILAGFVLSCPTSGEKKVVSLATGTKCLPATRLSMHGDSLNDSHAEVLARRGFLRWICSEVQRIHAVQSTYESRWITRLANGKYRLRERIKLHMYISALPCGDASTKFLSFNQDEATATLKDSTTFPDQPADKPWRGRNNYHCYGVLRTKPGRADSPLTLSMSCSDKIASWNILGLQGALGAQIFVPLYISSVIIGEVEEGIRDTVNQDCYRAFFRRIGNLKGLPHGYMVNHPAICFTSLQFVHSRSSISKLSSVSSSCNLSLCWIADTTSTPNHQVLINGLKRGVPPKHQHVPKYRPTLCKLALYQVFHQTYLESVGLPHAQVTNYSKSKEMSRDYQAAKSALLRTGPFTAWIRNGDKWQSFDLDGNIADPPAELAEDAAYQRQISGDSNENLRIPAFPH